VRGAMAFGLKAVARAMRHHGLVQTEWTDGPTDGLGAMVGAWSCDAEAQEAGCRMVELPLMESIGHYNQVDCKVLEEIVISVQKVSDLIREIAAASQVQSVGITQVNTVPSGAARQGVLSTGSARVDPAISRYLQAFYPLPNGPLLGNGDTGIFSFAGQQITTENYFTTKLDHKFSERDSIKREAARALVESDGAWISTQVLSELANVLTRRLGVPVREARERIMSIAVGCEVVLVSPPIVYEALRIKERFGYNFYDSQIIAAALACGASVLYSEDLHHGQTVDGKLSIRSPFRLRAEQRAKPYRTTKRRAVARA